VINYYQKEEFCTNKKPLQKVKELIVIIYKPAATTGRVSKVTFNELKLFVKVALSICIVWYTQLMKLFTSKH